jgi:hypothetical protein
MIGGRAAYRLRAIRRRPFRPADAIHRLCKIGRLAGERFRSALDGEAQQAEFRAEVPGMRETPRGFLIERTHHRRHQCRRQILNELSDRLRLLVDDLHHHDGRRVALEGPMAREQLVEHDAARKDVGAAVDFTARDLLGRHVEGTPENAARIRHRRRGDFRDAEVEQLDRAVVEQPDVRRLHVAVHDALLVGVMQAGQELGDDVELLHERQRRPALHALREALAAQELHRDIGGAVVFGELVDRDDVPVLQPGGSAGLTIEARARGLVRREIARHHFDRHFAIEDGIAAAIEQTHPAAAHALDHFVSTNACRRLQLDSSPERGIVEDQTIRPNRHWRAAPQLEPVNPLLFGPGAVLTAEIDEHVAAVLGPHFGVKPGNRAIRILQDNVVLRAAANRHDAAAQLDRAVHGIGPKHQNARGSSAFRP